MPDTATINILVSPLNWGSGHATRLSVICSELSVRGHKIFVAAEACHRHIFDDKDIAGFIELPASRIRYSSFLPQYVAVLLQLPFLVYYFFRDRLHAGRLVRRYDIDVLISDNRFGFWSRRVYSVYVTHQLRVMLPRVFRFMQGVVSWKHRMLAGCYDEVWVPDFKEGDYLSGRLSHDCRLPGAVRFIGTLSRGQGAGGNMNMGTDRCGMRVVAGSRGHGAGGELHQRERDDRFTLLLLSGPEPQRSMFEGMVVARERDFDGMIVVAGGNINMGTDRCGRRAASELYAGRRSGDLHQRENDTGDRVLRCGWVDGDELWWLIRHAEHIICRPGYSTVMDLYHMGRKALVVPTPGQPEQEYLGEYLEERYGFVNMVQRELPGAELLFPREDDGFGPGDREQGQLAATMDEFFKKLQE